MTSGLRSPLRLAGITLVALLSAVPACGESSATTDETPISGDAGSGGDAGAAGSSAGTGGTAGKGGSGGSAAGKGGASGASGQAGGGAAGKGGAGGSTAGSAGTAGSTAGAAGTAGKGGTGGSTAGAGGSTAGAGGSTAGAGGSAAGAAGTGGSAAGAAGTGGSAAGAAGTGGSAGAGGATATECTVGGKTYADGAADPTNPCRSCQVAVSATDFSPVPDTTSCGVARVCDAGKCLEPTVFTIVLENTSYEKVVGDTTNVPYLNSLIAKYGLATKYSDSGTHPSLPNYLYMISGETQYLGVIDLEPTQGSFPVDKDNLGLQLTTAGVPWRAYMESMGTPCGLATKGTYAPKHNPFVYFKSLQNNSTLCAQVDVDYSLFAADLAAGNYRYMWITPNLDSDGHDTDIATADKWCAANVPAILDSEVFKKNGYLFITWDEGSGTILTSDHIAMIVASPHLKSAGYTTDVAYTHASYLATVEDMYKVPRLGAAKNAATMFEFFK